MAKKSLELSSMGWKTILATREPESKCLVCKVYELHHDCFTIIAGNSVTSLIFQRIDSRDDQLDRRIKREIMCENEMKSLYHPQSRNASLILVPSMRS